MEESSSEEIKELRNRIKELEKQYKNSKDEEKLDKSLNRRQFIKTASLGALGLGIAGTASAFRISGSDFQLDLPNNKRFVVNDDGSIEGTITGNQKLNSLLGEGMSIDSEGKLSNTASSGSVVLESRTSDPSNPSVGEMWYRSDLQGSIEDFERTNPLSDYNLDTANFGIVNSPVKNGSYALQEQTASGWSWIQSFSGLGTYVEQDKTYRLNMYLPSGAAGNFIWFAQSSSNDGYMVRVDQAANSLNVYKRNSTTGIIQQSDATIPTNEWLELELTHASNGDISVTLFNSNGTQIGSVSVNDTTYISGGIGWAETNGVSGVTFDHLREV